MNDSFANDPRVNQHLSRGLGRPQDRLRPFPLRYVPQHQAAIGSPQDTGEDGTEGRLLKLPPHK